VGSFKEKGGMEDPGINGKNILKEVMARHHLPRDRNMNLETAVRFP
jgi:hypothetical protein